MDPNSLVSVFFKSTYKASPLIWHTQQHHAARRPAWARRSVTHVASFLRKGIAWNVGDGNQICTTNDVWTIKPSINFQSTIIPASRPLWVGELMDQTARQWNRNLVNRLFNDEDAKAILCTYIPRLPRYDSIYSKFSANGRYSVKSRYALLCKEVLGLDEIALWIQHKCSKFWSVKALPSWKIFCWK